MEKRKGIMNISFSTKIFLASIIGHLKCTNNYSLYFRSTIYVELALDLIINNIIFYSATYEKSRMLV